MYTWVMQGLAMWQVSRRRHAARLSPQRAPWLAFETTKPSVGARMAFRASAPSPCNKSPTCKRILFTPGPQTPANPLPFGLFLEVLSCCVTHFSSSDTFARHSLVCV